MAAEDVVIANTQPATYTGSSGISAITRQLTAPSAASHEAALATGHPETSTRDTTHGARIRPKLPPPATNALANGPAWNQRTAISRRKMVPAASMTPAAGARQHSDRKSTRLNSSH